MCSGLLGRTEGLHCPVRTGEAADQLLLFLIRGHHALLDHVRNNTLPVKTALSLFSSGTNIGDKVARTALVPHQILAWHLGRGPVGQEE